MSTMIKWPSISQYREVVKNVQHRSIYVGQDADGNVIVDRTRKAPSLTFEGTVKLHGTNSAIAFTPDNNAGAYWCQSRENIITPEKDNAGFAMFVKAHEVPFNMLLIQGYSQTTIDIRMANFVVFGEWCGGNIQKGVAISQLPKMFIVFGMALVDAEGQKTYLTRTQVERAVRSSNDLIEQHAPIKLVFKSIYDFETYTMVIDFENPHESQNLLNDITLAVEQECPVGKALGATAENGSMIGEGIVWRCVDPGYADSGFWFKVKGSAHANSKVKTLATVDVDKINNINQLAEMLASTGRLDQMCQQTFDLLNGGEIDINRTGDFIRAVFADIVKEELDTIAASGFNMKELNGPISKLARRYIMNQSV